MEEIGTVIKTDTEFAIVEVQKGSECKACEMKDACVESSQEGYRKLRAKNDLNSKIGDKVIVEIEPKAHVFSSFIVFILPVVFAVISTQGVGEEVFCTQFTKPPECKSDVTERGCIGLTLRHINILTYSQFLIFFE